MTYFISIDGDDIGNMIAEAYMNNDENSLSRINEQLSTNMQYIYNELKSANFEIIFYAADGIACKGSSLDLPEFAAFLKSQGTTMYTFSAGIGHDLQGAFFALKYAKSTGKNRVVITHNGNLFTTIENKQG